MSEDISQPAGKQPKKLRLTQEKVAIIKWEGCRMWAVYALLSALFAAATAILAKIGVEGVNSNLATAIRTVVILVMAWGIVF